MVGVLVHVCVSSKGSKSSKPVLANRPCVKLKKVSINIAYQQQGARRFVLLRQASIYQAFGPPHSASVVILLVQLPITQ